MQGLRKGQKEAWPNTPCNGDIFHALKEFSTVCCSLENRAFRSLKTFYDLEKKLKRPKRLSLKERGKEKALLKRWESVKKESERACMLFDDLSILYEWLAKDIFAVIGPPLDERKELFRFIIQQLRLRQ